MALCPIQYLQWEMGMRLPGRSGEDMMEFNGWLLFSCVAVYTLDILLCDYEAVTDIPFMGGKGRWEGDVMYMYLAYLPI